MIQVGRQITRMNDPLEKITIGRLFRGISRPKQHFCDLILQLRLVRDMDEGRYKELKKQLPYFVCGIFHPAIRRKEHFAAIEYFMLDLDHLSASGIDKSVLKRQLCQLPEVLMLFESPGADGLKVMFQLSEKCTDSALFSAFYKLFTRRFAERHNLTQVVDFQTSDVTRACFLSYDPDAYFNEAPTLVDVPVFLPDLNFDKAEKDIKEAEKMAKAVAKQRPTAGGPDEDALLKIKQKLNPNFRQPKEKQYFVPKAVNDMVPILTDKLEEFDMKLIGTQPISYGRKVKIAHNSLWAEINIFYGKQGFKVVKTTKTGSNAELAEVAAQVLTQLLATLELKQRKDG